MGYGQTTGAITYRYTVDGHEVNVTRVHAGTAYARNGNVGAATEYFLWNSTADGKPTGTNIETRSEAYERARAAALGIEYRLPRYVGGRLIDHPAVNVRHFRVVQREMKANYKGRTVHNG